MKFIIAILLLISITATAAVVTYGGKVTCTVPKSRADRTPLAASEIERLNLWTVRANGTKNSRMISWSTGCGAYGFFVPGMRYAVTVTAKDKTESALSNVVTFQR